MEVKVYGEYKFLDLSNKGFGFPKTNCVPSFFLGIKSYIVVLKRRIINGSLIVLTIFFLMFCLNFLILYEFDKKISYFVFSFCSLSSQSKMTPNHV